MDELNRVLYQHMGLSFAFVLGTGCIAGLLRHRTQGEMCYLCNSIAIVCLLFALILAPFWIRVVILAALLGERVFKATRNAPMNDQRDAQTVADAGQMNELLSQETDTQTISEPQLQYRGVSYSEEKLAIAPVVECQFQYRGVSYKLTDQDNQ
jgi:hypothetical protein